MKKRYVLFFVITLMLLVGNEAAFSQQEPKSRQSEYYKIISAESLKALIDNNTRMMVVDARTEKEYRQGHVPGAININPEKFRYIAGYLPKDKSMLIVFYCRGAT